MATTRVLGSEKRCSGRIVAHPEVMYDLAESARVTSEAAVVRPEWVPVFSLRQKNEVAKAQARPAS